MSWRQPFPDSTLTGHFGKIRTFKGAPSNPHRGTDWAPGADKVIPNITAGKVALIQWSNILGWVLVIQADDKPWFVGYCHLSCSTHGINCKGPAQKCSTPFKSTKVGHQGPRRASGQGGQHRLSELWRSPSRNSLKDPQGCVLWHCHGPSRSHRGKQS